MCKHLWWWLLHGSGHLCEVFAHMHPVCVSHELYGLCKRTAITKWRMSDNVRSRVSYVIKPISDAFRCRADSILERKLFLTLDCCMHGQVRAWMNRDFKSSVVLCSHLQATSLCHPKLFEFRIRTILWRLCALYSVQCMSAVDDVCLPRNIWMCFGYNETHGRVRCHT